MPFARIIAPSSLVISSQVLRSAVSADSVSSGQTHSCPQFVEHKKCSLVALDYRVGVGPVTGSCHVPPIEIELSIFHSFLHCLICEKSAPMSSAYLLYTFSE